MLRHGYAMVNMDIRGSGASFGSRSIPFSNEELEDGAQVLDWITKQPWSNGTLGVWGLSIESVSALMLLAKGNPAIKACFFDRGPFDMHESTHPGGVPARPGMAKWLRGWDRNELPQSLRPPFYLSIFMHGLPPVDGPEGRRLMMQALREHEKNGDVDQFASQVVFRDDVIHPLEIRAASIGPSAVAEQISASGTPLLILHGWLDDPAAGTQAYAGLTNPRRLIIGPWNHALQDASPFVAWHEGAFNLGGAVLQFFDYYLKGKQNGYDRMRPVQYFTLGSERWRGDDSWPPLTEPRRLYFGEDRQLNDRLSAVGEAYDTYTATKTFEPVAGPGEPLSEMKFMYADRRATDSKTLHYTSKPLTAKMEIVGNVQVDLWVDSSSSDDEFIAWIEDQDERGVAQYVTSGSLRGIHRRPSGSRSSDARLATHTFLRGDAMPLIPGEAAEIVFQLKPISYEFRPGHRIRVVIAGSDVSAFAPLPGPASVWKVHRDQLRSSSILLPVHQLEQISDAR